MQINFIAFTLSLLLLNSNCNDDKNFEEMIMKASGYYLDPNRAPGLNKTIVVTAR